MKTLSKCCNKPKVVNYTDEGTGAYLCQGCLGEFIPTTPKEEEILQSWLKRQSDGGQYIDGGNNYEEYCLDGYFNLRELVSSIRREAIAERDEEIVKILEDIIDTANEEMGFHAKHNQIYWNGVRSKLEVLRRHLTQE